MASSPKIPSFDFPALVSGLWLPMLFWTAAVILVTLMGAPGVICITPMAWLLAIPAGQKVVNGSRSQKDSHKIGQAAAAGAFLGMYQGILFLLIGLLLAPGGPPVQEGMLMYGLTIGVAGLFICGGLAAFFGAIQNNQNKNRKQR